MGESKYNFPVVYWGVDKSTRAQFAPTDKISENLIVSSCMVCVFNKNGEVLLSKPARGWGLPGGHLEPGETPEECAKREVYEETLVNIENLRLIGTWKIEKVFESEQNRKYPAKTQQLLFVASLDRVDEFVPSHESSDRKLVPIDEIEQYHHNFSSIAEVLRYIKNLRIDG